MEETSPLSTLSNPERAFSPEASAHRCYPTACFPSAIPLDNYQLATPTPAWLRTPTSTCYSQHTRIRALIYTNHNPIRSSHLLPIHSYWYYTSIPPTLISEDTSKTPVPHSIHALIARCRMGCPWTFKLLCNKGKFSRSKATAPKDNPLILDPT
jgi:hypothetical protein